MKKCRTCRYGRMYELDKPCVVYRADCPLYEKEGDAMNREEAIKILENERDNHINVCNGVFYETRTEAIDMAIKALEQEPSGDLISRQYLLDNCIVDKVTMPYVPVNKIKEAPSVNPQEPKTGHCKDCKYFEYDSVAKVDGIPLIVAHEICTRWGDGCKTKEDGYCFLYEPKESDHTCHTCKHYTSGEYDGSCDSYICKGYSDWESDNCN